MLRQLLKSLQPRGPEAPAFLDDLPASLLGRHSPQRAPRAMPGSTIAPARFASGELSRPGTRHRRSCPRSPQRPPRRAPKPIGGPVGADPRVRPCYSHVADAHRPSIPGVEWLIDRRSAVANHSAPPIAGGHGGPPLRILRRIPIRGHSRSRSAHFRAMALLACVAGSPDISKGRLTPPAETPTIPSRITTHPPSVAYSRRKKGQHDQSHHTLHGVTKTFGPKVAVRDLDLVVPAGRRSTGSSAPTAPARRPRSA